MLNNRYLNKHKLNKSYYIIYIIYLQLIHTSHHYKSNYYSLNIEITHKKYINLKIRNMFYNLDSITHIFHLFQESQVNNHKF